MFSSMIIQFLIKPKFVYFQECWIFYHGLANDGQIIGCHLFPATSYCFYICLYKKTPLSVKIYCMLTLDHLSFLDTSQWDGCRTRLLPAHWAFVVGQICLSVPPTSCNILSILFYFIPNINCWLGKRRQRGPLGKIATGNILRLFVFRATAYRHFWKY